MLFVNRISEILKDVGQQKDVRKKVVVVVVSQSPNFTSPIVIPRCARFVFQGIIEIFNRWELRLRKFLGSGHVGTGIDPLCKNQLVDVSTATARRRMRPAEPCARISIAKMTTAR